MTMNSCVIKSLIRKGIKRETKHFKIFIGEGSEGACAVIVSKSNGKAVQRNRLKKRLRSIHQKMKTPDAVYILKKGSGIPGYREMVIEIGENG